MRSDSLKAVLNEAEDDRSNNIVFGGEDNQKNSLYMDQEDRLTENVIVVNDDNLLDRVVDILKQDDNVQKFEFEEDDTIRIYST